eukprot:TRINITY_DN795_c0_g1_i1.p1 TRINITY_DN795_c0_g1~~TRINITY_DN795_c0_g1_i1.p1  ORF type:complete len:225 (+),score=53.34 TRINITY_DN795_c0_g1_i1:28-675(+)
MQDRDGSVSQYLFKVLILGDSSVGKTCFVRRYCHDSFIDDYKATICLDFGHKELVIPERNAIVKLQMWDLAGQEKTSRLLSVYFREAVGVIIAFDITKSSTFESVIRWKQDLDDKTCLPDGSRIPAILIATKSDLSNESVAPDKTYIQTFCNDHGFDAYYETSALKNTNVNETIDSLVNLILDRDVAPYTSKQENSNVIVESDNEDVVEPSGCNC